MAQTVPVNAAQEVAPNVNQNPRVETIPPDYSEDEGGNKMTVLKDLTESTWLEAIEMEQGYLSLVAGRSHLMRFNKRISRISVSDPEVMDFVIISPQEILLNARVEGATNVIVWDVKERVSVFDISVTRDPALLHELLKKIDPEGNFEIYPSRDVFVVKGEATNETKVREIESAANAFAEGSVTLVRVNEPKQVLLQIRFIQVDRNQDYDFGLDMEHARDTKQWNVFQRFLPGVTTAATSGDSTIALETPTNTADLFDRNDADIYQLALFGTDNTEFQLFVKALEAKGLAKTIARPNLLARDGEEASFLVGGEAAILVSTNNNVNVQYREFGTRLTFTPEILPEGKIRLSIAPEVSTLNSANGVTSGDTSVPGFSTTRVETVAELRDNESLVIGGLIQQKHTTVETGVPFLRRLPLIGKLFQSTESEMDLTELIVLITPRVITPDRIPVSGDGDDEHDILSVATKLMDDSLPDKQANAIRQYLDDHVRFKDPTADVRPVVSKPQSVKQRVKSKSGNAVVEIGPPLDLKTLDELETKLKWPSKT